MKMIKTIADRDAQGRLIGILEGDKGNHLAFCILETIEVTSREKQK